jgi:hypothetical protein
MKRSWKTRRQVPVTYSHSFSNNLFGTFEVECLGEKRRPRKQVDDGRS